MKSAFIFGYQFGLHEIKKYSDCLFAEGHLIESCIVADLLSQSEKFESAERARSRIIVKHFGLPKEDIKE